MSLLSSNKQCQNTESKSAHVNHTSGYQYWRANVKTAMSVCYLGSHLVKKGSLVGITMVGDLTPMTFEDPLATG